MDNIEVSLSNHRGPYIDNVKSEIVSLFSTGHP